MFEKPGNWKELKPQEKLAKRLDHFVEGADIQFVSAEAEAAYKERAALVRDAIELEKPPARVPVFVSASDYAIKRAGFTPRDAMYNPEKLVESLVAFQMEFPSDLGFVMVSGGGKALEHLDYKLYKWPGHGLPDTQGYQAVEGEYVTADEYPKLIADPSDFFMRTYLPRTFGELEALRMLPLLPIIQEIPMVPSALMPFAMPEVQAALKKLMEAAAFTMQDMMSIGALAGQVAANGFPGIFGGFSKAPFDAVGDTLRGTRGIMMDMYRNPDLVLEACDRFVPLMIQAGVSAIAATGNLAAMLPLHKGADGFMSEAQFEKFYWPSLKKVLLGLADEGILSLCFAEGSYNKRLEVISDLPTGIAAWMFDQTDMHRAKDILRNKACILGNVPTSLMAAGTSEQVRAYCRDLVEYCGRDGGFILTNGAIVEITTDENIRAMLDSVKG
jgi:uroporphyrinogen-III decarboxylase